MSAPGSLREALWAEVRARHPRSFKGIEEARAKNPERFDRTAETYLGWLKLARGENWLSASVDAFAQFSTEVILEQARYEAAGHYASSSFAQAEAEVYGRREVMDDYLWGVYLTNFLWAHHMEIMGLFQDRFVSRLPADARIVELAPGHGGWGIWALNQRPDARLEGYDISPSSMAIARAIAGAAGVGDRATYTRQNVLDLENLPVAAFDALICSFLVEHLEDPERLAAVIGRLVRPGGHVFFTGAIEAAQVDHIFEFRRESELIGLAERNGLRVRETLSVSPERILPKARFLPRSMALVCTRVTKETW